MSGGFISDMQAKALSEEAEASIWNNDQSKNTSQSSSQSSNEQQFTIQPHPAKSNDPNDLKQPSQGGYAANAGIQAHHARDPLIPDQNTLNSLGQPLSREELHNRQAELNE